MGNAAVGLHQSVHLLVNVIMSTKNLSGKLLTNKSWLLAVYFIFAVYLLVDLVVFQFSPYSGRISTLTCKPDEHKQMQCTATLHGWKEKYQQTFLASEFKRVVEIWVFPYGTSDSGSCGLKLQSTHGTMDFIHDRQPCWRIHSVRKTIFKHFNEHPSSPIKIVYLGWNFSVYTRLLLLLSVTWLLWFKKEWLESKLPFKNKFYGFRQFVIGWLKVNISLKIILYLTVFIIGGSWLMYNYQGEHGTFLRVCYDPWRLEQVCGNCAKPPLSYLIALYPLLAFVAIQGIIQWKFLKTKFDLSRWWIGAPAIASIALMIGINSEITCGDFKTLQYIPSGFWINIYTEMLPNIILYALILGLIQWLALRKHVSYSIGWIIIPVINTMLVPLGFLLTELSYPISYLLVIPFLLMLFFVAEAVQASYLSWIVNKKRKPNCECSEPI